LKQELAAVVLAVFALTTAGCATESWGCGMGMFGAGACPAMADVNGARYGVSGPVDLPGIEAHLTPFGPITQSNQAVAFADQTALAIDGVDPNVLLVVRAKQGPEDDPGAYRELWSMADDPFPVAYCAYLTPNRAAAQPECQVAPAS
jgi:hypothetical protein